MTRPLPPALPYHTQHGEGEARGFETEGFETRGSAYISIFNKDAASTAAETHEREEEADEEEEEEKEEEEEEEEEEEYRTRKEWGREDGEREGGG